MHGEDDTSPKTVAQSVVVRFITKSGLDKEFFLISFLYSLLCHGIVALGTIAQLEFLDNVITESTVAKISHTDAASVHMVAQDILEIVAGKLVDDEKAFAFALSELFFVRQFPLLDFDAVFLGEVFQRFGIRHLFMFHDEMYGIAPFAAGETFAQPFGGRHVE